MSEQAVAGGGERAGRTSSSRAALAVIYRTPPPWLRPLILWIFLGIIGLQLVEWAFGNLRGLIGLLFLAWLFAIAMEPVVSALNRRGMKRGLATGLVMLALFIGVVVFFSVFGNLLLQQLVDLGKALPSLVGQVIDWVNSTFKTNLDVKTIQDSLQLDTSKLVSLAGQLTGGLLGVVTSLVGLVFQGFMLLLFAFYMSAEQPQLRARVSSWFPQRQQRVISTVWGIAVSKTGGYVISRLLLAALSAFFTSLFLLILGIDYWLPLGLWTGLVSQFIPTIGTYLGGALPALIALSQGPIRGLAVVGFILVYQQLENYFFAPKITSRTVDIHPAMAFGAVVAGGALFGAMGALVAIPVVAAIESVVETYGKRYELIPELQHEPSSSEPEPSPESAAD